MSKDAITVLHVDDESDFAGTVAVFIEQENKRITVETATSAAEGHERLAEAPIDCVVSDYDMPGQSGIEFLESIREEYPDLPFILYTGKGSEAVASDAVSAGVTDYMQKETGTDQYTVLANRIENSVAQYRAKQEAERTRQQLQELTESTTDCRWIFDRDWDELLFISGYEEVWNREVTAIKENPTDFLNVVHPEDRDSVEQAMEHLSNGESVDIDYRIVRGDGSTGWIWAKGEPVFDDEGTVVRVVGLTRDITARKLRGRELTETKERMEFALESTDASIWEVDPTQNLVTSNPLHCSIFEDDIETVSDFYQSVHPDDRSKVRTSTERAVENRTATSIEFRATAEGQEQWVELQIKPVTDADGSVVKLTGLTHDITERKQRECHLERTRQRMELALSWTDSIIFEIDFDTGDVERHGAYEQFFTFESADVSTWNEHVNKVVHPEDRDTFRQSFRQLRDGDKESCEFEYRTNPKQGNVRWVNAYVQCRNESQTGARTAIGVARDITERKEQEEELCQTTARLEALFERSPDMINVHDIDGNLIDPNPCFCEKTGYDVAELASMNVWDIDKAIEPAEATAIWEKMDTGDRRRIETLYERKDGSTFPVEVHIRRLNLAGADRFLVIGRDITERKVREQELERQNERLDEFASVVSHDLRNPLNVAQGRMDVVQKECESPHFDVIQRAHHRMETLIDNLLTLARNRESSIELETLDLRTVSERCWQNVETGEATLDTNANLAVQADKSQLQQLLENLFRNAVNHGSHTVTVTIDELADGFSVADDGQGIHENDSDRIFEIGYSSASKGTGFGLSIVQQVAETHGWTVTVTESPDGGAQFNITDVTTR